MSLRDLNRSAQETGKEFFSQLLLRWNCSGSLCRNGPEMQTSVSLVIFVYILDLKKNVIASGHMKVLSLEKRWLPWHVSMKKQTQGLSFTWLLLFSKVIIILCLSGVLTQMYSFSFCIMSQNYHHQLQYTWMLD